MVYVVYMVSVCKRNSKHSFLLRNHNVFHLAGNKQMIWTLNQAKLESTHQINSLKADSLS